MPTAVSSSTYNDLGQMLSATDPWGAVTSMTYYTTKEMGVNGGHTKGDLASITEPGDLTTTFDLYDAHGRVLQSTGPSGLVTTMTYDPMGRLLSASAGGLTESYTYTRFGKKLTMTSAKGGVTLYGYDSAQRLISVTDPRGNVTRFALDDLGGITQETVEDSQGVIASTVTRVFDALHRVSKVTGAAK